MLGNGRRRNNPGNLLPTWSRHPRLTHANEMPQAVELHSNGTTRRAGRSHSEGEYHDRFTLPRLQVLWNLRQAQPSREHVWPSPQAASRTFELKFSGSTGSVDSNFKFVGTSADGKSKHTDGQAWGSPSWLRRVAFKFDVSTGIVNSESNCSQPLGCRCMCRVLSQPECRDQSCRGDEN